MRNSDSKVSSKSVFKEVLDGNFSELFKTSFSSINPPDFSIKKTAFDKMLLAAKTLYSKWGIELVDELVTNPSEIVRGWGCFIVGYSSLNFHESLIKIKPFADSKSKSVREWANLAMRSKLISNPSKNIHLLNPFVYHPSEYMRRFAIELSRPRGLLSSPIEFLKEKPWKARSLLDPLYNDPSRYVQMSVGDWLLDARESSSKWVDEVTTHWAKISTSPYTDYIIKRAKK